jgi:hypothetical protein
LCVFSCAAQEYNNIEQLEESVLATRIGPFDDFEPIGNMNFVRPGVFMKVAANCAPNMASFDEVMVGFRVSLAAPKASTSASSLSFEPDMTHGRQQGGNVVGSVWRQADVM